MAKFSLFKSVVPPKCISFLLLLPTCNALIINASVKQYQLLSTFDSQLSDISVEHHDSYATRRMSKLFCFAAELLCNPDSDYNLSNCRAAPRQKCEWFGLAWKTDSDIWPIPSLILQQPKSAQFSLWSPLNRSGSKTKQHHSFIH